MQLIALILFIFDIIGLLLLLRYECGWTFGLE